MPRLRINLKGDGNVVFQGTSLMPLVSVCCLADWFSLLISELLRTKKLPMAKFLDVCAPPVLVGLGLGRVGCFMAGCCFGDICVPPSQMTALDPARAYQVQTIPALSPSFLGVQFPKKSDAFAQHSKLGLIDKDATKSLPVHAVQLYEAVIALALAIWLHRRKPLFDGEIAIRLLACYSVARFVLEFFRGDNRPIYWGMTISQVTSLLLLVVAVAAVWWLRMRKTIRVAPLELGSNAVSKL